MFLAPLTISMSKLSISIEAMWQGSTNNTSQVASPFSMTSPSTSKNIMPFLVNF